jgi:hypothetical protein
MINLIKFLLNCLLTLLLFFKKEKYLIKYINIGIRKFKRLSSQFYLIKKLINKIIVE